MRFILNANSEIPKMMLNRFAQSHHFRNRSKFTAANFDTFRNSCKTVSFADLELALRLAESLFYLYERASSAL